MGLYRARESPHYYPACVFASRKAAAAQPEPSDLRRMSVIWKLVLCVTLLETLSTLLVTQNQHAREVVAEGVTTHPDGLVTCQKGPAVHY